MYPWIIITFAMAAIVLGIDYLLRRKTWKNNSAEEKISLLINMFSVGPYVFLSILGMLWGIVPNNPQTTFAEVLYDATLLLGEIYIVIAAAAVIASLVLRRNGNIKGSIWVNVISLAYIAVVLAVNSFVGKNL